MATTAEIYAKQLAEKRADQLDVTECELIDVANHDGENRLRQLVLELAVANSVTYRSILNALDGNADILPNQLDVLFETALIELMRLGILQNKYAEQVADWQKIQHLYPNHESTASEKNCTPPDITRDTMTVYYPWRRQGSLQPILRQKQFNEVVYSRNSGIISQEAQQRLARIKVLIVGAGVGGNIAKMLAMAGVQNFVIVDAGTVDLHNLNRTSYAGVPDLGVDLATLVSREIKELNPYATVEKHNALLSVDEGPPNMNDRGVSTVHFGDVVQGCEVLIEGVDNLFMKYLIQMSALRSGLVTLMPSDLGMGANLKIVAGEPFNGNLAMDQMMKQIGIIQQAPPDQQYRLMTDLAREIIGEKNVPPHMLEAIKVAVENNFGFYPQTGVAAALAASLVTEQIIQFAELGKSTGAKDVTIDLRPLS